MKVIEIRLKKTPNFPTRITVVYEGLGNTRIHWVRGNWRVWLENRGLVGKPRIWE